MASLYDDLFGVVRISNHESDLYVMATPEACAILKRHGATYRAFRSGLDGRLWFDVPFAYTPFWCDHGPISPFNNSGLM